MIKNFDVQIIGENGEPEVSGGKPVLALEVVLKALTVTLPEEQDGEDKFKRYQLWERLKGGGDQEVSPEEVVMLKSRIGKFFNVNAVGQLYKILNS